jgi:hypothetical protein
VRTRRPAWVALAYWLMVSVVIRAEMCPVALVAYCHHNWGRATPEADPRRQYYPINRSQTPARFFAR